MFFIFSKNSFINCRFRLKLRAMRLLRKHFIAKRRFQQLPNLTIRSLLKIKEGLKQATEIELPVLMRVFFKTRLSTAISHFVTKSLFQQLPNLKIRSLLKSKEGLKSATKIALLKSKEGLKTATEIELLFLMASFFSKTRLSTAISHFVVKSRFQQLSNLKIRSLLKSKEGKI